MDSWKDTSVVKANILQPRKPFWTLNVSVHLMFAMCPYTSEKNMCGCHLMFIRFVHAAHNLSRFHWQVSSIFHPLAQWFRMQRASLRYARWALDCSTDLGSKYNVLAVYQRSCWQPNHYVCSLLFWRTSLGLLELDFQVLRYQPGCGRNNWILGPLNYTVMGSNCLSHGL